MIPLSAPQIGGNEWSYIKQCLDTGWVSSAGEFVSQFEERFKGYVGAPYAVATSNGTAALHLALIALGLKADFEVLAPTITFAASINAIHYCGAKPVFFDCDRFFNIDLDAVERFLTDGCESRGAETFNKSSGRKVWGILPVHVFGNPVDMARVNALAHRHALHVVEDAAESVGSYFEGQHTGTFAEAGCFSFNGNKIITTGGGGMVVTRSKDVADKVRYLSTQAKDDALRFIHHEVGYNYRLTNLQAAMGVAQLELLPKYLARKKEIHNRYCTELNSAGFLSVCPVPEENPGNYWLVNVLLSKDSGLRALDLVAKLSAQGIESRPVWYPNHLQRASSGCQAFEIRNAEDLVERTVSIPCSVGLRAEDQAKVIAALLAAG